MMSLQGSHLPEAAEILDILNRIEFEGLFYSHDKLADLQVRGYRIQSRLRYTVLCAVDFSGSGTDVRFGLVRKKEKDCLVGH